MELCTVNPEDLKLAAESIADAVFWALVAAYFFGLISAPFVYDLVAVTWRLVRRHVFKARKTTF